MWLCWREVKNSQSLPLPAQSLPHHGAVTGALQTRGTTPLLAGEGRGAHCGQGLCSWNASLGVLTPQSRNSINSRGIQFCNTRTLLVCCHLVKLQRLGPWWNELCVQTWHENLGLRGVFVIAKAGEELYLKTECEIKVPSPCIARKHLGSHHILFISENLAELHLPSSILHSFHVQALFLTFHSSKCPFSSEMSCFTPIIFF